MELDDLRQSWAEVNRRLDTSMRLNARLLDEAVLNRAERATRRLTRLLLIELLVNIVAVVWLGSFLAANLSDPRFVVPAAVLDLCVIGLLIAGIRQLAAVGGVDYSQPVLVIQKRLESLRAERIRATMFTLVAAPLLWTPMFIVALKGLFGVDAYLVFSVAWLISNVVFGLLVVAIAVLISRHYAGRTQTSEFLQGLMQALAGQSLATASEFVASIARFEEEPARQ